MRKKIFGIGFSGGLDSLVTTHMLLKQYKDAEFILVHFVIDNEQELFTSYAAYELYKYLKSNFNNKILFKYVTLLETNDYKTIAQYLLKRDDKSNVSITSLNAGHSDLPHYYGSRNALYLSYLMSTLEAYVRSQNYDSKSVELIPVLGIHVHSTYRQYWDTKGSFILVMKQLARLNDMYTIIPDAPILNYTKRQIVQYIVMHKLPYQLTWTCYTPEIIKHSKNYVIAKPCKKCQACVEREEAAKNLIDGINDYEFVIDLNFIEDDEINNKDDTVKVLETFPIIGTESEKTKESKEKETSKTEETNQRRKKKNKDNTIEQKDKTDTIFDITEFTETNKDNIDTT